MSSTPDRRTFLGAAGGLAVAPRPSAAANTRLVVGVMGMGNRGPALARAFAALPDTAVAYVCDVDAGRVGRAADALEKEGRPRPKAVADFRRILDDKGVDALVVAAPNHWHAPAAILACAAGKHVYVEKPCSHTPREGELLVAAARKHDRRVQMGNQRRSWPKVREAVAALRDGVIGRVYLAQGWYADDRPSIGAGEATDPPAGLDYDRWQGPAPRRPFRSNYLHYNWHWFWHWGNGELGNNGVHMIDLCRWGLGVDFPAKVTSAGGRFRYADDQETPDTHLVGFDFPGGRTLTWEGLSCNRPPREKPADVLFQGERGSLAIAGGGYTVYDPAGKPVKTETGPGGDGPHVANFAAAVRGDGPLTSEIEEGHKSTLLCHLGNIAHRAGRSLRCDAKTGRPDADPEAMKFWGREYAPGWEPKV